MARYCPQFTVRRLMVAVAIVALIFGLGGWMERRAEGFRRQEDYHIKAWQVFVPYPTNRPPARATYHFDLSNKYERAARYPWLPVAPDPPEPE